MRNDALQCPICYGPVTPRGHNRGNQRYCCYNSADHPTGKPWHGTDVINKLSADAAGIDRDTSRALSSAIRRGTGPRRYVITAAQNATPVNKPFLQNLLAYCKHNDAQLVVIPYRYKNPTSVWSQRAQDHDWWADELAPYIMNLRTDIGKHVTILADVMMQPTAKQPLVGLENLVGARSAIIGHPKLALTTVATPQQKLPKILTTTGAVTVKNYLAGKAGKQGEHHHTFGACVLEVKGDTFHIRQINAVKNGSFCDLNYEYVAGRAKKAEVAAIVLGDFHREFVDPKVVSGTFDKGGLVDTLKPGQLVWHDIHDFYSGSHHHKKKTFTRLAKMKAGIDNVREELYKTFTTVARLAEPYTDTLNVFVNSNHHDHLGQWVEETDPRKDLTNALFWAETFTMMGESAHMGRSKAHVIDPFAEWGKLMLPDYPCGRYRFLKEDESWTILEIECGHHGHVGSNGARGSRKGYAKIGVKTFIGHSHAPGIEEGCYQVGTSSYLDLEYNHGASGWMTTHGLIYKNGKRALINIVNGKWHL